MSAKKGQTTAVKILDAEQKHQFNLNLIDFVKYHRPIWDSEDEHFMNVHIKNICWEEFVDTYRRDEPDITCDIESVKRTWKSLKDAWNREDKRLYPTGRTGVRSSREEGKVWKYYDKLSFLSGNAEFAESEEVTHGESMQYLSLDYGEEQSSPAKKVDHQPKNALNRSPKQQGLPKAKRAKTSDDQMRRTLNEMNHKIDFLVDNKRMIDEDGHYNFAISLADSLKLITDPIKKIKLRAEIMKLVAEWVDK